MPQITTVTERLEKSFVKHLRIEADQVFFLMGKKKYVDAALLNADNLAESLQRGFKGVTADAFPLGQITKFRQRSDRKSILIAFRNENGKNRSIEINVADPSKRKAIDDHLGPLLKGSGLQRINKPASALAVAWKPVLLILGTAFVGGLVTLSQTQGGIEAPDSSGGFSGGRSAKKAKGIAVLFRVVANALGFWGCLLLTLAIIGFAAWTLIRKLTQRPTITEYRLES